MKKLIIFTALLLVIRGGVAGQIRSEYLIDLDDTEKISHILPRIPGIESSAVDANEMKSTIGIALDQYFYVKNREDYVRPRIKSFNYSIVRNMQVIASSQSNSPLWDDAIRSDFKKIKKGDSLFVYNVKAFVRIKDSVIDLFELPNLVFDTLKLTFTSSIILPSERELSLNRRLQKLPGFSKLVELYGSDIVIDRSVQYVGFKYNKTNGQCQVQYQFSTDNRTDYDFTFIGNRNNIPVRVYDNLHKKNYTVKEWENMIKALH